MNIFATRFLSNGIKLNRFVSKCRHAQLFVHQKYCMSSICKSDFEKFCDETLDTLSEYFDEVAEIENVPKEFDVSLESGVLTIHVSKTIGTYVINKQAPNKQIWLSSPLSGPKRYDFLNNTWLYVHDGKYLHQLLEEEFTKHLSFTIDLSKLPFHYKNK